MTRYGKCTNIDDDCPKAKSGEVIPIEGARELVCPDCGVELFEVPKPAQPTPKWLKPALLAGVLCLLIGIVWAFWPITPDQRKSTIKLSPIDKLTVNVTGVDCETGKLSVAVAGGDSSSISFSAKGLSTGQNSNEFTIPKAERNGKLFTFIATQSGISSKVNYLTNCPHNQGKVGIHPPQTTPVVFRKVEGSEFCVGDCILAYSEVDNLGHIREKRIENYAKCCPAGR